MTDDRQRWVEFFDITSEMNAWLCFLGVDEFTETDRQRGYEICRKFEDWRVEHLGA